MQSLKQELDNILSGHRKHLRVDAELIAKANASQSPQDVSQRNCRALDRFVPLVNCLSDVAKFVDWFWGYYYGEKKSKEAKELLAENEKLKAQVKRKSEELKRLQELAGARKKKLENWLVVMRRLNDKVELLNRKQKVREYLTKVG